MRLGMGLSQLLAHRCGTCGELVLEDVRQEDMTSAALFGVATRYDICPMCLQEPSNEVKIDHEYRRKVRVLLYTRYGIVIREPANAVN